MGSPELFVKWKGRENEVHSAITYSIQTPGKAVNFPACSSTRCIQQEYWGLAGISLSNPRPLSAIREHRIHARHEEPQPGGEAAQRTCSGLPILPCPPAWQGLSTGSSIQGSSPAAALGLQACGRRDQGHAQLFPQVSLFCSYCLHLSCHCFVSILTLSSTQIWDLFSGYKQGHLDIHSYTEGMHKLRTLRTACKTEFSVFSDQQMEKPKPVSIWHVSFHTGITTYLWSKQIAS